MSPEMLQYEASTSNSPYQVTESMVSYSTEANSERIRISEPGESEHDELLLNKLGEKGWGRFHYFRNEFSSVWGDGEGRPLSPKSQETFFTFLRISNISKEINPSLFLTDNGHLEICWEDASGNSIQFEFGPYESEVYLEASETELTFPNSKLAEQLKRFDLA